MEKDELRHRKEPLLVDILNPLDCQDFGAMTNMNEFSI